MNGCRPFTNDEVHRLFEHGFEGPYATRDKLLFAVGISTGFRISEILAMRVCDLVKKNHILPYYAVPRLKMKGKHKARTKRLSETAQRLAKDWIAELKELRGEKYNAQTFVFQSREGGNRHISINLVNINLRKACERIGIIEPKRLIASHSMRKTYSKRLYDYYREQFINKKIDHEPILMLNRSLDHVSVENTMKYLSFMTDDIPNTILEVQETLP